MRTIHYISRATHGECCELADQLVAGIGELHRGLDIGRGEASYATFIMGTTVYVNSLGGSGFYTCEEITL